MNNYIESVFFQNMTDQQNDLVSMMNGFKNDEFNAEKDILIDTAEYREAMNMHLLDPFHSAVREFITSSVLNSEPEINIPKDAKMLLPEIIEFIKDVWIKKLAPKIMSESWILGLVPIEMIEDHETSFPVPMVYHRGLGINYNIAIREKKQGCKVEYRFYPIKKKFSIRGKNVINRKVRIYNEFNSEPMSSTGKLMSTAARLLNTKRNYDENYRIARVALMNMSRPMILLETNRLSQGLGDAQMNRPLPLYGGQDYVDEEHREHVAMTAGHLDLLARQQASFWEKYYDDIEEMTSNGQQSIHQAHHNLIPLPFDHRSATYQPSRMRNDWNTLNEIYEETVASTYGIQRIHIRSFQGKFQANEIIANDILVKTINNWRKILSIIYTDLFEETFGKNSGTIVFPEIVNDTFEGLKDKWEIGLLTWEGFRNLTHEYSGINLKYMNKNEPERLIEESHDKGDTKNLKQKRKRSEESSEEKKVEKKVEKEKNTDAMNGKNDKKKKS